MIVMKRSLRRRKKELCCGVLKRKAGEKAKSPRERTGTAGQRTKVTGKATSFGGKEN